MLEWTRADRESRATSAEGAGQREIAQNAKACEDARATRKCESGEERENARAMGDVRMRER